MSGKVLTIDAAGNKKERPTSFPTVAAAELASFLPGETISVLETRRDYQFDSASVEVRDGIRVLTPAGGGRLLMTAPVMTDAEVAAVIRIATTSQSGLMSAAQAQSVANSAVAGSSGQVQYNSNGVLGATLNLKWDDSNERLGIGTSSPQRPLHIANNGSQSQILLEDNDAASGLKYGGLKFVDGAFQINTMDDALDPTTRLHISPTTGNVGIGTTTPSAKLEILNASNYQLRLSHTGGSVYSTLTTDSSGNLNITPSGTTTSINTTYLNGFHTLLLGVGGISGNAYFRSAGEVSSVINMQVKIKDSTGALQDGIAFYPTWINSTPGSHNVSTAVGALGMTAFTINSTNTTTSTNFNGDVGVNKSSPTAKTHIKGSTSGNTAYGLKVDNSSNAKNFYVRCDGQIDSSGSRIIGYETFLTDTTLTQSSMSCVVINPPGTGVVITMHLSLADGIKQRTVNISAFAVTLGRNSQKMAGAEANYTLPAYTAIDWQYYGATIGWIPISISTW